MSSIDSTFGEANAFGRSLRPCRATGERWRMQQHHCCAVSQSRRLQHYGYWQ